MQALTTNCLVNGKTWKWNKSINYDSGTLQMIVSKGTSPLLASHNEKDDDGTLYDTLWCVPNVATKMMHLHAVRASYELISLFKKNYVSMVCLLIRNWRNKKNDHYINNFWENQFYNISLSKSHKYTDKTLIQT